MRFEGRILWSAALGAFCATSVLAGAGLLSAPLRPTYADSAPTAPISEERGATEAASEAFAPTASAQAEFVADPPPAAEPSPLAWLRPAFSEEDFTVWPEPAAPAGLAFVAVPPPPAMFAALVTPHGDTPAAEPGAAAPEVVQVRPPARPVFPRRKLASLNVDGGLTAEAEPEVATPAEPPRDEGRLLGSWSDPFGRTTTAREDEPAFQTGVASWYGPRFHGRRTASGAVFNQNALTAAHRHLPFGTRVKVVNETTGQSVVVTITDRGPFSHGRVIDLSRASARAVGMGGLARVKLVRSDE